MLKTMLASVVTLGLFVSPAVVSAQSTEEAAQPAPVVATQLAGFDSFNNAPLFGTLNGGFLVGIAAATVVILGTQSDTTSGTR